MEAGVENGSPGRKPQCHLVSCNSCAEPGGEGKAVVGTEGAAHVSHHELSHSLHQRVDALVKAESLGPVPASDAHGEQLRREGGGSGSDERKELKRDPRISSSMTDTQQQESKDKNNNPVVIC